MAHYTYRALDKQGEIVQDKLEGSGTMAVAYVQFHWKLQLADSQWLPIVNKGELAVVYCFLFLFIAARGPGLLALDARRA